MYMYICRYVCIFHTTFIKEFKAPIYFLIASIENNKIKWNWNNHVSILFGVSYSIMNIIMFPCFPKHTKFINWLLFDIVCCLKTNQKISKTLRDFEVGLIFFKYTYIGTLWYAVCNMWCGGYGDVLSNPHTLIRDVLTVYPFKDCLSCRKHLFQDHSLLGRA